MQDQCQRARSCLFIWVGVGGHDRGLRWGSNPASALTQPLTHGGAVLRGASMLWGQTDRAQNNHSPEHPPLHPRRPHSLSEPQFPHLLKGVLM